MIKLKFKLKNKLYFNWSSGKDASMSLFVLQQQGNFAIKKLVTTINSHYHRVSMHGLRTELLEKQAESIGIPLHKIELPRQPSMEDYTSIMKTNVDSFRNEGFSYTAFGDIYLEDLRKYRDDQLNPLGIQTVYPIWKKDPIELIKQFISLNFKAIIICVSSEFLDESWLGREIDENFLNDLPENVDPCGENGEFHTFCYDGPIFNDPVEFTKGESTYREYNTESITSGFWFLDLL